MFESEADRLALIKAVGGEPFSTGNPEKLWGVFDREYEASSVGELVVANRRTVLQCRESDVEIHELVKNDLIRRDKDDKAYAIADFEHDGTGMTVVVLRA